MPWASIVGAGIGLLSSSMNKQGSTTSSGAPWPGQSPYLVRGYHAGDRLLSESFGGMAPFQSALRARAGGSPVSNEAQNLAAGTLRGDYLNSNPFLDQAVSRASGEAQSRINSQFGPFNNYGSSAHQEQMGRGIMEAALPYLSQNYENERGRQFAALSQAPALQGMDYQNIGALQQADFAPWDFLGRYTQSVQGNPGGGTQTTPYFTNPYASAAGGALLGNQLYKSFQQPSSSTYGSPNDMSASWLGLGG